MFYIFCWFDFQTFDGIEDNSGISRLEGGVAGRVSVPTVRYVLLTTSVYADASTWRPHAEGSACIIITVPHEETLGFSCLQLQSHQQ